MLGQILGAPVPPLTAYRKDAPAWLGAICEQALAKEPTARFPGMAEFARALDTYLEPTGSNRAPSAPRPTAPQPPPAPPREVSVELVRAPSLPKPEKPKSKTPPKVEPQPVAASLFEQMVAPAPTTVASRPPARPVWRNPVLIAAAVLLPLVAWGAAVVLRVETPNGTLVVKLDDPGVEARIKNGKLILSGPDGKDRYTLSAADRDKTIDAGAYKVRVEGADGLSLDTPEFTMKKGDRVTVRVKLEPKAVAKKGDPAPLLLARPDGIRDSNPAVIDNDRRAALEVLSLGGTLRVDDEIDNINISTEAELPRRPFRLTRVNFQENNKVTNANMAVLKECKHLTHFNCYASQVTDDGLSRLKNCSDLMCLDIRNSRITDEGLTHLKSLAKLKEVWLYKDPVGDRGIAALTRSKDMELLDAAWTLITDDALLHVKEFTKLKTLYLHNNRNITDIGLDHLIGMKSLSRLSLEDTMTTNAGVARIKAALPNCNITR